MADPFADLDRLPGPDRAAGEAVATRARQVLRPDGAFARLDEIAVWLAEWQRTPAPAVDKPSALVFAADHGVVSEGVSAYPESITKVMLASLEEGSATASVLAASVGADLKAIDVGVGEPTGNIAEQPALDHAEFAGAVEVGRHSVGDLDADLIILGELGIGNTTIAAAIAYSLFGGDVDDWVGPGSGLDEAGIARKASVVRAAVGRAGPVDPLEALRQLGGAELAAIAGACLEARIRSIPVLIDGYVVAAALMPLEMHTPGALSHCWPGHLSPEPGHRRLVDALGRRPIVDLELRLGEGSGALVALPLVRLAAAAVVEVATFGEKGLD